MKPKILIVDDVSENIHILSNMLKDDFKIMAATSGKKALELAQKMPQPDLIILDILMPEMDGYEVCRALKLNKKTEHIPVVFVSSLNETEDVEKGFAAGASEFITKPVIKSLVRNRLLNQVKMNPYYLENSKEDACDSSKDTILIVDDAPENIELILEILKDDYNLIIAQSGKKALDILKVQKPDLILLDIIMPDIDGYKLCQTIKANNRLKDIPVVFLTVLENTQDIVTGLSLGAIDYVSKPVEPIVLKAKINTHLKLKHYQDRLKEQLDEKEDLLLKQSKLATLGEMFENITHQWNQPLSVISLSSGTIKMKSELETLDDETLFKSLDSIEFATKHLSQTISDFRDFLKDDISKQEFLVADIIENTLKLLESRLKSKGVSVQKSIENVSICTYKSALVHVLMNILGNALDALIEKEIENKTIDIQVSENSEDITILVKDNAGGIEESIIENIFDKYVSTKLDKKGSGVGLYMTKKLVNENLNGEVKCYNVADGAVFEVTFPKK